VELDAFGEALDVARIGAGGRRVVVARVIEPGQQVVELPERQGQDAGADNIGDLGQMPPQAVLTVERNEGSLAPE
jgi:hypothetical protein